MCGSRGVIDGRKGKDAFPPRVPFQKAASCPLREEIKLSRDVFFPPSRADGRKKKEEKTGQGWTETNNGTSLVHFPTGPPAWRFRFALRPIRRRPAIARHRSKRERTNQRAAFSLGYYVVCVLIQLCPFGFKFVTDERETTTTNYNKHPFFDRDFAP